MTRRKRDDVLRYVKRETTKSNGKITVTCRILQTAPNKKASPRKGGCIFFSDVEAEVSNVAVLHDVILAFKANESFVASGVD